MTGPLIFINYRRSHFEDGVQQDLDTGSVRSIETALNNVYGAGKVFRDVDDLGAGAVFNDDIRRAIAGCKVFLAVIGPRWLDALDHAGNRRLDDPADWVRMEIELALERDDLLVVPVLVGGAKLPSRGELPESLRPLLARNAVKLVDDGTYNSAFAKITDAIDALLEAEKGPEPAPEPTRRGFVPLAPALAAAVVVILLVGGLFITRRGGGSDEAAEGSPTSAQATDGSATDSTAAADAISDAPRRAPMTGDFNIAVAEFTSSDGADAATAQAVAIRLTEELRRAFPDDDSAPIRTSVIGPDETGRLPALPPGATPDERAATALALADELNATVVIGGNVDEAGFNAEATLSPEALPSYPEFTGPWSFGTKPFSRDALVQRDRVNDLTDATAGVAHLVRGISYYQRIDEPGDAVMNRELARAAFEEALDAAAFPDKGKAAAHTFLGSLNLLSPDLSAPQPFAAALSSFEQALSLDPTSARARLGLAEVALQQSRGDACMAGVDAAGLDDAARAFESIITDDIDPTVGTKARLGRARVLRCRSQAGLSDDFDLVRTILDDVIATSDGDPVLVEVAATAHAELALAIAPEVGPEVDPTTFEAALRASLDETLKALDRTQRDENRALILWQKAFYLKQLADLTQTVDPSEAEAALDEAAQLDQRFGSLTIESLIPPASGRMVPTTDSSTFWPGLIGLVATGYEVLGQLVLALCLVAAGATLTHEANRRA